jgi:hypothetical protein
MLRNLVILVTLISFCPVAVGAQEAALRVKQQAPEQSAATAAAPPDLNVPVRAEKAAPKLLVAENDQSSPAAAEAPRQPKTHTGLTFKEFCEVHFGEYRWVYWVGAVGAIVLFHVFAVGKD